MKNLKLRLLKTAFILLLALIICTDNAHAQVLPPEDSILPMELYQAKNRAEKMALDYGAKTNNERGARFISGLLKAQSIYTLETNEPSSDKLDTMDTTTYQFRGKTIRWAWMEGFGAKSDTPVEYTHEHIFHMDGTITWKVISGPQKGHYETEEEYASTKVADGIYAVSYLAKSGYTLTVILNFKEMWMIGFASGKEVWRIGSGPFEEIEQ